MPAMALEGATAAPPPPPQSRISAEERRRDARGGGDGREERLLSVTDLCDDTLHRILSFSDLPSLVRFANGTSRRLRSRFGRRRARRAEGGGWEDELRHPDVWREAFVRHNLAPVEATGGARFFDCGALGAAARGDGNEADLSLMSLSLLEGADATFDIGREELFLGDGREARQLSIPLADYFDELRRRLSLWSRLRGGEKMRNGRGGGPSPRKGRKRQCFSLPSRCFRFVPLVPPDMMHFPPPAGVAGGSANNNEFSFTILDDDDEEGEDEFGHGAGLGDDVHQVGANAESDGGGGDAQSFAFDDPPPVEFSCDSFCLTSPSTGGEYVLLNPFTGSVEVYGSVLDNAAPGGDEDERLLLEMGWMDAAEGIVRKRRGGADADEEDGDEERSEVIAGEAIHARLLGQFGRSKMYDVPPRQVLFSVDDYFDLDVNEYFGEGTPFFSLGAFGNRRRRGNVTVDWVGVDSHIALAEGDHSVIAGNIVGAARILSMEPGDGAPGVEEEELECTEIFAWSNFEEESVRGVGKTSPPSYDAKFVCRAAGSFYFLDICANFRKLYAAFQSGKCPFRDSVGDGRRDDGGRFGNRNLMDIEEESVVNDDGEPIRMSREIYCLPLVRYGGSPSSPREASSYFPTYDSVIRAQYPVSSFSVDPTGRYLVVGSTSGTIEVWNTGMDARGGGGGCPVRLQFLSVHESFVKRHRSMTMIERHASASGGGDGDLDAKPAAIGAEPASETRDDLALLDNNGGGSAAEESAELPHKHPTSKISQIYLPRHLPAHRCGFVTKQRSIEHGTTLLLWQVAGGLPSSSSEDSLDFDGRRFQITAMINLPLSAQCHPEVHFDGRRLVVFGKDHIGLIFLVYHVLSTRFDQREFDEDEEGSSASRGSPKKARAAAGLGGVAGRSEESGGVVQLLAGERRVKFVNRIRHAGVGGLEYYDSMLLTANERFLVVNTKTGNLVGSDGARNATEGLIVIDLQEEHHSH